MAFVGSGLSDENYCTVKPVHLNDKLFYSEKDWCLNFTEVKLTLKIKKIDLTSFSFYIAVWFIQGLIFRTGFVELPFPKQVITEILLKVVLNTINQTK